MAGSPIRQQAQYKGGDEPRPYEDIDPNPGSAFPLFNLFAFFFVLFVPFLPFVVQTRAD